MHWNVWAVFNNPIFIIGMIAWFLAQAIKMFTPLFSGGKFQPAMILNSGGMPSSHSAVALSITVAVGMILGFDSAIFVVSMAFSSIVMYDAAGVRLETGKQAEIINSLVSFIKEHDEFSAETLKELIGHKPAEVFFGAILGIGIAVVYCSFLI